MENSTPKTKIQDNYKNNDDTDAGRLKKLIENVGIEKLNILLNDLSKVEKIYQTRQKRRIKIIKIKN